MYLRHYDARLAQARKRTVGIAFVQGNSNPKTLFLRSECVSPESNKLIPKIYRSIEIPASIINISPAMESLMVSYSSGLCACNSSKVISWTTTSPSLL